jgi:predicted phage tail protein
MEQTVRLLDDLGERYGSEHVYFNLRSPAEAIKLLCINHPALQKELTEAHQHGVGYTLVQAGTFLGYEDLRLPLGKNDLVLAPVITGSGGSTGTILAGVGLVALSIVAAPLGAGFLGLGAGAFTATTGTALVAGTATSFATTAVLSAASVAIGSLGAGLILSGTAQLLSPQPTIPTLNNRTAPGQNTNAAGPQGVSRATSGQQSYAFAGPANTVGVGATVPLVYGKLLIGSHLLSSRVRVADDSNPTGEFFGITGGRSVRINGEKPGNKFKALNGLRTRTWSDEQVRLANDPDSDPEAKKKIPQKKVGFGETSKQTVGGLKEYDTDEDNQENFQVLLEINKGLFNIIGGQFVPAFVTYELTITKDDYTGGDESFASVRGTVQGLLKQTDRFKFAHAITYGVSGLEDSDTTVRLGFRIIDTDADPSGQFVIRGVGYEHFTQDSENDTADLSET